MRKKKKWKKQRYGKYYNKIMQPQRLEAYNAFIKRVKTLKKQVKSLGKIPEKKTQLIKTINYFVNLINLVTQFVDSGLLEYPPKHKYSEIAYFHEVLVCIMARTENSASYHNRSLPGQSVNYNNLYLGMFSDIASEDITPDTPICFINGEAKKVEAEMFSFSDWINNRAITNDGYMAIINQKELAIVDKNLTDILLETIDSVLS